MLDLRVLTFCDRLGGVSKIDQGQGKFNLALALQCLLCTGKQVHRYIQVDYRPCDRPARRKNFCARWNVILQCLRLNQPLPYMSQGLKSGKIKLCVNHSIGDAQMNLLLHKHKLQRHHKEMQCTRLQAPIYFTVQATVSSASSSDSYADLLDSVRVHRLTHRREVSLPSNGCLRLPCHGSRSVLTALLSQSCDHICTHNFEADLAT